MKGRWTIPACPECHEPLAYQSALNRWSCRAHGPVWSGEALAEVNGFRMSA